MHSIRSTTSLRAFAIPTGRRPPEPGHTGTSWAIGQAIADFAATADRQYRKYTWCTGSEPMEQFTVEFAQADRSLAANEAGADPVSSRSGRCCRRRSMWHRAPDEHSGTTRALVVRRPCSSSVRDFWPSLLAVVVLSRPGHHRLAAESRVRPFRAGAGRLGRCLCSSSVSRPFAGFLLFVAGRSDCPVPIARLGLPATVRPARSAEHASRIRAQGNRDLRLRSLRANGRTPGTCPGENYNGPGHREKGTA